MDCSIRLRVPHTVPFLLDVSAAFAVYRVPFPSRFGYSVSCRNETSHPRARSLGRQIIAATTGETAAPGETLDMKSSACVISDGGHHQFAARQCIHLSIVHSSTTG
jgi:hypothetical protein